MRTPLLTLIGSINLFLYFFLFGATASAHKIDDRIPIPDRYRARIGELEEILDPETMRDVRKGKAVFAPLHYAILFNNQALAQALILQHHADPNNRSFSNADEEEIPLTLAARMGQTEMVAFLLDHGAKINDTNSQYYTPLHEAAEHGHKEVVDLLLKRGANVDARSFGEETPLHKAANSIDFSRDSENQKSDNEKIIQLLLQHKAQVNAVNLESTTPLHYAAGRGNEEAVQLLLKAGADINAKTGNGGGFTPLYQAARGGSKKVVDLLLEKRANVRVVSDEGFTLLHAAAEGGNKEIVELFLRRGLDVNATDQRKNTPLHLAAENGKAEVAELLLDRGAEIDAKDRYGSTPLRDAVLHRKKEMVQLLLQRRASVNVVTTHGDTPLHMAIQLRDSEIVKLLLQGGADVNAVAADGNTPLHTATLQGDSEIVKLLLQGGASIQSNPHNNHTPLHDAVEKGRRDLFDLLLKQSGRGDAVNPTELVAFTYQEDQTKMAEYLIKSQFPSISYAISSLIKSSPHQFATAPEFISARLQLGFTLDPHQIQAAPILHSLVRKILTFVPDPANNQELNHILSQIQDLKVHRDQAVLDHILMYAAAQGKEDFVSILLQAGARPFKALNNLEIAQENNYITAAKRLKLKEIYEKLLHADLAWDAILFRQTCNKPWEKPQSYFEILPHELQGALMGYLGDPKFQEELQQQSSRRAEAVEALRRQNEGRLYEEAFRAIEAGDIKKVRTALDQGLNPNTRNAQGYTFLWAAVTHPNPEIAEKLLKILLNNPNRADPNPAFFYPEQSTGRHEQILTAHQRHSVQPQITLFRALAEKSNDWLRSRQDVLHFLIYNSMDEVAPVESQLLNARLMALNPHAAQNKRRARSLSPSAGKKTRILRETRGKRSRDEDATENE